LQVALTLHLACHIGLGSRDARSRLLACFPWLAARSSLLPLGFEPGIFTPESDGMGHERVGQDLLGGPLGENTIVCVASWTAVKGHELLLDAVRLLLDGGVTARLLLVGERTDGPDAVAAVARRGLEGQVAGLGALPQLEVASLLRAARVSVITSWHEAQCLAIVESLACGTPVIAAKIGVASELLVNSKVGQVVAARSPAQVAAALRIQLARSAGSSSADRALRQAAVGHMALPEVVTRFLGVYERLMEGDL